MKLAWVYFFCALCYDIKTHCFSAKQKQNSLTVETAMHARFDFPPSPRGRTKYIKYAAPYYNTVIVHTTYQSSATSIDQWLLCTMFKTGETKLSKIRCLFLVTVSVCIKEVLDTLITYYDVLSFKINKTKSIVIYY